MAFFMYKSEISLAKKTIKSHFQENFKYHTDKCINQKIKDTFHKIKDS